MSEEDIRKLLAISPLFRHMPENLVIEKLSPLETISISEGETLLIAGRRNATIYIIMSGRLKVQTGPSDQEPIALLGEGECVGELSILGDTGVSAYVIAATDCVLLPIDQSILWSLIDTSHQAARNMLNILSDRVRYADKIIAESLERSQGYVTTPIIDDLTGLYNREWMMKRFERHLCRSLVDKRSCCLMQLEFDDFDGYLSTYGELAGDQAMRDLAQHVLLGLRPADQAGRSSRRRLSVFMPNTNIEEACIAAQRLSQMVSRSEVVLPSGDALPALTISLGMSQVRKGDHLEDIFARASSALALAKKSGGQCYKIVE